MSTLEVREASEALGDVGDSGGCPGRGGLCFSFAVLFWVLTAEIRLQILHLGHFVQLRAAIPTLTGRAFAHYLALFTINLVGNYYFFSREGFDKPAQAYFLLLKIFLSCREKINNKKNRF